MSRAEAWILRRRQPDAPQRAQLERCSVDVGRLQADEALVAPLYGSWEANMTHALERQPIDICAARDEEAVVVGNAASVRVLDVGREVTEVEPGQLAILHSAGEVDRHGYMTRALGYDAPGQMGCLATQMRLKGRQLIPIPSDSAHTAAQWAGFGIRYVTAWANWRLALGVARAFRDADTAPALEVWGWGGGTTLAELDLAHRQGHSCVMLSGTDTHLARISKLGITAIDRRAFGPLAYDPTADSEQRRAYQRAEEAFVQEVAQRTDGEGAHIFVDYIGAPVWRATRRAIAREGVVTTAGWKRGMKLEFLRASECIGHRQFIHTHFAPREQAVHAVAFGEATGWIPEPPDRIYSFDELPELVEAYAAGGAGYFPCYAIEPQ